MYGSGQRDYISVEISSSPSDCQQKCENTDGCTAFVYKDATTSNCYKYRGGPYTYGTGITGYTCYIMPGI